MAAQFIIFKETSDQDLAVENGTFIMLEDEDAVVQQIGTVLRLAKFDWFLDLDEGLRYVDGERGILGASELSLENEAEIIETINNVFGVRQLVSLTAAFLTATSFRISAVVTTIFSERQVSTSITVS